MKNLSSCVYEGTVVHKRLSPRQNGFSYRVFTLCLDIDEIDRIDSELRLFSRNRRNIMSIHDRDLGAPGFEALGIKIRNLLAESGLSKFTEKIELVCYPRLLGYVFNPLSVYFCKSAAGEVGAVVYEVSNTFRERKSYVIPVASTGNSIAQTCNKEMYVSPFTGSSGSYGFHALPPTDKVVVGVNFREDGKPVLKTHFRGERRPLNDAMIARLMLRYPLMTLKVIGAIHFEAAKLWAKGIPLVHRHSSPSYSFTIVDNPKQDVRHA